MGENIKMAFRGIKTHKLRSALTMLGVIIGIAAIIAIVSSIKGTNEQIKRNLVGSGNNTVEVGLSQGGMEYEVEYGGIPAGIRPVDEETKKAIMDLSSVENVSLYKKRSYQNNIFYMGQQTSGASIYGVDADYFAVAGLCIKEGRLFSKSDLQKNVKIAVLDEAMAKGLFGTEKAAGKVIDIKGEPFTVVGVVKNISTFEPVIENLQDYETYMNDGQARIFIPITIWPVLYIYDEPENVLIKAVSTDSMTNAGRDAQEILNASIKEVPGSGGMQEGSEEGSSSVKYKANDVLEIANRLQETSRSTNILLIAVAAISLLVGAIGVANIMLVSVTERTTEIGLKKAIGAKKTVIRRQFLTEAVVLTAMGGILGVIIGIIVARVMAAVMQTNMALDIPWMILAFAISMGVGIVAGIGPAIKASNLNPIEALRRE